MSILRRIFFYLLCALGFCASSMYVWSYLSQSQNSLRTVVFGLFLIIIRSRRRSISVRISMCQSAISRIRRSLPWRYSWTVTPKGRHCMPTATEG